MSNNDLSDNGETFKFGYSNNKYGYKDSNNVFHPFKLGLEDGTTLWTNSSPSSSFSAQGISLNDDMLNYEYIAIYFNKANNNTVSNVMIFKVSDMLADTLNRGCLATRIGTINRYRPFNINNTTSIGFGSSFYTDSSDKVVNNNNSNIPTQVVGY